MARIKNIIGQRYGQLTVESMADKRGQGNALMYTVRCDCGKTTTVMGRALRQGTTRSCGCMRGTRDFVEKPKLLKTNAEKAFSTCLSKYCEIRAVSPIRLSSSQHCAVGPSIRLLDFAIDFEKLLIPFAKRSAEEIGNELIKQGLYPVNSYFNA